MLGASAACCGVIPNSTTLRKNWSRFWSWLSPPCTAKARNGAPSLSARVGVSVTRGRFPGSMTLYGPSAGSVTKLCIRWLRPTPVRPAMAPWPQPPLGVTDTTQPSESAASIEVVPRLNCSRKSSPTDSAEGWPTDSPEGWPTDSAEGWPTDSAEGWPTDSAEGWPTDSAEGWPTDFTGCCSV